jgi:transposase
MIKPNNIFHLSDKFWNKIKHLIPQVENKKRPGRPRMDDRKALDAIFYVLRTGCQWNAIDRELGASSTVHDRFKFWVKRGFFKALWKQELLDYDARIGVKWEFQIIDGCQVMAPLAGECTGASYKHRGKTGTNRSLLTDEKGIPIGLVIERANLNDFKLTLDTLKSIIIDRPAPTKLQEQHFFADKGYDYAEVDLTVAQWGYTAHISRRGVDVNIMEIPPKYRAKRWVVERSHAWLNKFRRLLIRWEKKSDHYLAMLHFACAMICFRK